MATFGDAILLGCVGGSCVVAYPMIREEWFETDEFTAIVGIKTFDFCLESVFDKFFLN